jgi:hypothetical protein
VRTCRRRGVAIDLVLERRLEHVPSGFAPELLARLQVRYPGVPIVFCDTRPLAEEWTFRFLGAALAHLDAERDLNIEVEQ